MQPVDGRATRASSSGSTRCAVRCSTTSMQKARAAREHNVAVVDLPRIERVRLTYEYPEWTGLDAARRTKTSRDIRAVAGTNVKVEVVRRCAARSAGADRRRQHRRAGSSRVAASTGAIAVAKPGRYQIGARVANEFVALSDEYRDRDRSRREADDRDPQARPRLARHQHRGGAGAHPGARTISACATCRCATRSTAANGSACRWAAARRRSDSESLLRPGRARRRAGERTSKQRLVPGDLVSYYAVAKDRKADGADRSVHGAGAAVRAPLHAGAGRRQRWRRHGRRAGRDLRAAARDPACDLESAAQRRAQLALARSSSKTARRCSRSCRPRSRNRRARWRNARAPALRFEEDERITTFVESLERAAGVMDPAVDASE